jgi:hypothetical protein
MNNKINAIEKMIQFHIESKKEKNFSFLYKFSSLVNQKYNTLKYKTNIFKLNEKNC